MIGEHLRRDRVYSEVIELTPWDFCDDSLLPGPLLVHSCNMKMRLFANYYWNIFNRVEDKKVTYEIPLINMSILNNKIDFLDERRLLFQSSVCSVFDRTMIQVETRIFKGVHPFEEIASCNWHGVECWHNDPDDWVLGEFKEVPDIIPELSMLLPETQRPIVENVNTAINRISAPAAWLGPVETRHKLLHPYCEYGFMGAFMNYVGPLISLGKEAIIGWLKENCPESYPSRLARKLNYRNWKSWISIKKAFFFNDDLLVRTSYLKANARDYLKHELYSLKPRVLKNIILEEFSPD